MLAQAHNNRVAGRYLLDKYLIYATILSLLVPPVTDWHLPYNQIKVWVAKKHRIGANFLVSLQTIIL